MKREDFAAFVGGTIEAVICLAEASGKQPYAAIFGACEKKHYSARQK
jgi:hypothetical protein